MKILLILSAFVLFIDYAFSQQTIPNLITKEFAVESTTKASKPCPAMTETQRDAIVSPTTGRCVYNTTALKLNIYNGSIWKAAGGGIEDWVTGFSYAVGDVVIESGNIYQANTAHTSTVFASDIANWDLLTIETPNSSTNNAVAVFSGTTGKSITDSPVTIDGSGDAVGFNSINVGALNLLNNEVSSLSGLYLWPGGAPNEVQVAGNLAIINNGYFSTNALTDSTTTGSNATLSIPGNKNIRLTNASLVSISMITDGNLGREITLINQTGRDITLNHDTGATAANRIDTGISANLPLKNGNSIDLVYGGTSSRWNVKSVPNNLLAYVDNDTGWIAYTPTISNLGTVSSVEFFWKRSGDSISIRGVFICGTAAASAASFTLPNSYTARALASNTIWLSGRWARNTSAGSTRKASNLIFTQSQNAINFGNDDYSTAQSAFTAQLGSNICSASDVLEVEAHGIPITGLTATNPNFLASPDTFSTDTNTLTFKTSAVTSSDPVGTFSTYSYTINTNTRTVCATAPTQTTSDMNTNGILIYTRAYNAASTCAQPAAIAIQIGKGLKGVSRNLYKSIIKSISGNLDPQFIAGSATEYGAIYNDYSETTGILIIDTGTKLSSATTSHVFLFGDQSAQTSGYLVINASKNPALTGFDLQTVVKSEGQNGTDIQSVYFGTGANCSSACTTGTCTICRRVGTKITSVTWDSTGKYRLNGIDGTKYTCSKGSALTNTYTPPLVVPTSQTSTYALVEFVNTAAALTNASYVSVECTGIP